MREHRQFLKHNIVEEIRSEQDCGEHPNSMSSPAQNPHPQHILQCSGTYLAQYHDLPNNSVLDIKIEVKDGCHRSGDEGMRQLSFQRACSAFDVDLGTIGFVGASMSPVKFQNLSKNTGSTGKIESCC